MTCTLSDVLEALCGTDVNFEIVKSQTVRPLKMNYVHNRVDVRRAFIFVQTELEGFAKWKKMKHEGWRTVDDPNGWIANDKAEQVKQQLEDKDALGIVEVEVFTDLSKEETIETFRRIKEESVKFTEENNCTLGLVFSTIGFGLGVEERKDQLLFRDAPLSDTTMAHFYAITTAGKFINYSQLVADITSHPSIAAVLIHEYD